MKKIFLLAFSSLFVFGLASCNKEIDPIDQIEPTISEGHVPFELVADVIEAKSSIDADWNVSWNDNDIIYAVTTDAEWGKPYTQDKSGETIAEYTYSKGSFSTGKTISDGEHTFNFIYTQASQKSYHRSDITTNKLSASQVQDCSDPLAGLGQYDVTAAQTTVTTPTGSVNVTMAHLYSFMKVTLKNKTEDELNITSFNIKMTDAALAGVYEVIFGDNPAVAVQDSQEYFDDITVTLANGTIAANGELPVYIVMAPVSGFSGDVTFTATSSDNKVFTKTNTVSNVSFAAGTYNTANFSLKNPEIVVDYVTLPWSWEGGASADFTSITGVSANGLGSDYAATHSPYLIKFDNSNDYFIIKTDSPIGVVSIGVKMIGGSSSSSFKIQGSADGTNYTDVQTLTISGTQNSEHTLSTTFAFDPSYRYVKATFTKGSNVGVGPISISKADTAPAILANDISGVAAAGVINEEGSYVAKNFTDDVEVTAFTGCVTDAIADGGELVYTVAPNYSGAAVNGTIVLCSTADNTITKTIAVSQLADKFMVSETSLQLGNPANSSKTFKVTSTYAVTITNPNSDKISISPMQIEAGSENAVVTVTALAQNMSEEDVDEIGNIVITRTTAETDSNKTKSIAVSQDVKPAEGSVSYTLTFPDENSSNNGVGSYSDTWTATADDFSWTIHNFNNNRWSSWTYIKCGSNKNASVADITTATVIPEAIKTVTITIDKVSNVNSATLYVSSNSNFTDATEYSIPQSTGNQTITIANPAVNLYYKIEFNCSKASSNGPVQISKVVYSNN